MNDGRKDRTAKDSHYARLRRARRDSQPGAAERRRRPDHAPAEVPDGLVRLYGLHTVRAALDNPRRALTRMLVTRNAAARLDLDDIAALPFEARLAEPAEIDRLLGSDAVHQGVVLEAEPLAPKTFSDLGDASLVLILDQVTDPHNVGAIMRTAVAFGAAALITTARHSPQESGVLAKAASGALEHIDHIQVRNLGECIEKLNAMGFLTLGLDSEGPEMLEAALDGERIALVLGAEGKGLRQKTRTLVGALARLDMPGPIRSLNVSNAAAISLYAARRHLDRGAMAAHLPAAGAVS